MDFTQFRTRAIPYFISSNMMSISTLYFKFSTVLIHYVSDDSALLSMNRMFTISSQVHNYNSHSLPLVIFRGNTLD